MTPRDDGEPLLVTRRLDLWRPSASDLPEIVAIVADEQTGRFLGPGRSYADQATRFMRNAGSWYLYGYGVFTLRPRGHAEILGSAGIFHSWRGLGEDFDDHPEAGWILRKDSTGQGYASEAVGAALDWFDAEHGPRRIVCAIEHGNDRSFALAAKVGFERMRDAVFPDGAEVTLLAREP